MKTVRVKVRLVEIVEYLVDVDDDHDVTDLGWFDREFAQHGGDWDIANRDLTDQDIIRVVVAT